MSDDEGVRSRVTATDMCPIWAHINKDRGAWRTSRAGGPSCLSRQTIQTNGAVAVVFHSFGSPKFALGPRNVLQQRAPACSYSTTAAGARASGGSGPLVGLLSFQQIRL